MRFRQGAKNDQIVEPLKLCRHAVGCGVVDIGFIHHDKRPSGKRLAKGDNSVAFHQVRRRIVRRTDKDHLGVVIHGCQNALAIKTEPVRQRHLAGLNPLQHGGLRIHGKGWRADDDVVHRRHAKGPYQAVDPLVRAAHHSDVARGQIQPVTDRPHQFGRLLHRIARQPGRTDKGLIGTFIGIQVNGAVAGGHKRACRDISLHGLNFWAGSRRHAFNHRIIAHIR